MKHALLLTSAITLLLTLSACDESVSPITGTEFKYSMYGLISTQFDTQWVRVYPVRTRLEPEKPEKLDAILTTEDLVTGSERVWTDSVFLDNDAQWAHIFYSVFRPEHGHRYRFSIQDGSGTEATSEVTMPIAAQIRVDPVTVFSPVTVSAKVGGGIPRLNNVWVHYTVKFAASPNPLEGQQTFFVDYGGFQRQEGEDWHIPIDMSGDFQQIRAELAAQHKYDLGYGIALLSMEVHAEVANEEWNPPGGSFDRNVLVQPGIMDNVENGFGFIGAGYKLNVQFMPEENVWKAAGYSPQR